MNRRTVRTAAALLALLLLVSTVCTGALFIWSAGHSCSEVCCPVCAALHALHSLLFTLTIGLPLAAALRYLLKTYPVSVAPACGAATPVALKVRLLN